MTETDYINSVTRIYRTDRIGSHLHGYSPTPEQAEYLGRFVGLLSRGGALRLAAIKADEEARIADLVRRFEECDATITTLAR